MTNTDAMQKQIHEGRNVKRFREMLGIKQEALAYELGDDWNQQKVSLLEQKETIDPNTAATDFCCIKNTCGSHTEF